MLIKFSILKIFIQNDYIINITIRIQLNFSKIDRSKYKTIKNIFKFV